MNENDIVTPSDIYAKEEQMDVQIEETIEIIEVSNPETYTIETDSAFPSLGEGNEELKHQLLNGRELSDQHPISAITGLREELDNIQALQTVYSDKKQVADYYEWEDGNQAAEDRVGYFVSICDDIRMIKICNGENVYGVTVDEAAFVGGQDDIVRDFKYALVVHSGVAHVRCELDVNVGDFVISNSYGIATKSDSNYGCRVIALHDINGILHATVALNISADQINTLGNEVASLVGRMDVAEINIVSAINVANEASKKADEIGEVSEGAIKNALDAMDKANDASEKTNGFEERLENANELAVQAQALALNASNSALAIKDEAIKMANDTLATVNNLVKDLEPISEWTDPETGNVGAEYLTTYIQNGLATKAEVQTVETKTEENKSAILHNAESLRTMVSSIDKYSVGEYSPAYGLTQEQAESILEVGMIYVPTQDHGYHLDDTYQFSQKFYYVWDGKRWIESGAPQVAFSNTYIIGNENNPYWYIPNDDNVVYEGKTYEAKTLYFWDIDRWIAVATLAGSVETRKTSLIRQTVDGVSAEVTNVHGSVSALDVRLTETESSVQSLALWSKDADGNQYNLATIKQTADDAGASVAQVAAEICGKYTTIEGVWDEIDKDTNEVYYTTEDKKYWYYKDSAWANTDYPTEAGLKVNAASIITAVNNDTSGVFISGEHINLKGCVTFESFDEDTKKQIEADTIDVQIWSSRGNIFKSRDVSSILTCYVFKGGVDITDSLPNTAFTWQKFNDDGTQDVMWTATPYGNNANMIQISTADIFSRAMFKCAVEI